MDINELKNVVEAALLASATPMTVNQLGQLFDEESAVTREALVQTLHALHEDCGNRGVELAEVASGYRYQIRRSVYPWVSKMWTERPSRYSRAMLETLVLIAYRQPITRGEIEQVRGVVVSSSIIRTLEEREWIRVVGHRDMPGRPALFGTTREFLDYFNLKSLDELPPLAEIRELDDLDPQFDFEQPPRAGATHPGSPDEDAGETDAPAETPTAGETRGESSDQDHERNDDVEATSLADNGDDVTHEGPANAAEPAGHHAADIHAAAPPPHATAEEAEARAEDDHAEQQHQGENDRASVPNDTKENSA